MKAPHLCAVLGILHAVSVLGYGDVRFMVRAVTPTERTGHRTLNCVHRVLTVDMPGGTLDIWGDVWSPVVGG